MPVAAASVAAHAWHRTRDQPLLDATSTAPLVGRDAKNKCLRSLVVPAEAASHSSSFDIILIGQGINQENARRSELTVQILTESVPIYSSFLIRSRIPRGTDVPLAIVCLPYPISRPASGCALEGSSGFSSRPRRPSHEKAPAATLARLGRNWQPRGQNRRQLRGPGGRLRPRLAQS